MYEAIIIIDCRTVATRGEITDPSEETLHFLVVLSSLAQSEFCIKGDGMTYRCTNL